MDACIVRGVLAEYVDGLAEDLAGINARINAPAKDRMETDEAGLQRLVSMKNALTSNIANERVLKMMPTDQLSHVPVKCIIDGMQLLDMTDPIVRVAQTPHSSSSLYDPHLIRS